VNIQLTTFDEFNSSSISSSYEKMYAPNQSLIETDATAHEPERERHTLKTLMKLIDIPIQGILYISVPNSPLQNHSKLR
jgi:hypothetical protein